MFFVATLIGPAVELDVGPRSPAVLRLLQTASRLTESQASPPLPAPVA